MLRRDATASRQSSSTKYPRTGFIRLLRWILLLDWAVVGWYFGNLSNDVIHMTPANFQDFGGFVTEHILPFPLITESFQPWGTAIVGGICLVLVGGGVWATRDLYAERRTLQAKRVVAIRACLWPVLMMLVLVLTAWALRLGVNLGWLADVLRGLALTLVGGTVLSGIAVLIGGFANRRKNRQGGGGGMAPPRPMDTDQVPNELLQVGMPAIQGAVSSNAGRYQSITRWILASILLITAVYAIASPVAQLPVVAEIHGFKVNLASAIAGLGFALAFVLNVTRLIYRPDRKWYSSRGLSEEIKSFAWRFAVGGLPFGRAQFSPVDAGELLSQTLHAFLRQARKERLEIPLPNDAGTLPFITDWMSTAREASLPVRQALYAEKRILYQQRYYREHARTFQQRSRWWNLSLVGIELVLAVAAGLHAIGLIPLDFFGVGATVVAAGTSWVQFNQYRALTDLYSDMAFELGEFHRRCLHPAQGWTEDTWAAFVGSVEGFLAAEHGSWRKLVDPDGLEGATLTNP